MKPTLKIDIVSDIVCPWCYIGKRRLEKAMQYLGEEFDFQLEHRPFELNPSIPKHGLNQQEYLIEKFGGKDRFEAITDYVTEVARQEGLAFNYAKQTVAPNTRLSHSLIGLTKTEGDQMAMVELLFHAYFIDGMDLSKENTLVTLAEKAGLVRKKVKHHLADEAAMLQIALEEQEMYKLGITGVPFFIVNNKYGISGAQTSATFIKALREIGSEVTSGHSLAVGGQTS